MQVVRGCVEKNVDGVEQPMSRVVLCPAPASTENKASAPQAEPASAPASASASAPTAEPRPAATAACGAGAGGRYPWLLSIGGVLAVERATECIRTNADGTPVPIQVQHVRIQGGLAVPMFVVVLAFIGGAVSLSRRIPEYQRRSELCYVPTEKEPAMKAFQARESTVFQIMQLVSAPFLAVATWYIVSPSTIASAAVLAFGTGFWSEPLLLIIRGMVEGIRPEGQRQTAPAAVDLKGKVVDQAGTAPQPNKAVTLKAVGAVESRMTSTSSSGAFAFAQVTPGRYVLSVEGGDRVELTIGGKLPDDLVLKLT